ncbi:MAG: SDR family NAD(P)-dependent oxidoreductase [Caulobacteraceae bacterium]
MSEARPLEGRSALITGAASGIGRAAVLRFCEAGARVFAFDRSNAVDETVRLARDAGGEAFAITGDAGNEADVEGAVARVIAETGRIDALFANAGIGGTLRRLLDQDVEEWTEVLRVDLIGPFLAARAAARHMIAQGSGAIVCTASVAGIRSGAAAGPYSAAKAGVISLVQTTANDLAGTGVRINAVCPGLIETGMTQFLFEKARERGTEEKIGQLNPTRRSGVPDEIARVALFLCTDAASYVNGQAIAVDGGLTSSLPVLPPRPKS